MAKWFPLLWFFFIASPGLSQDVLVESYDGATTLEQYTDFRQQFTYRNDGIVDINRRVISLNYLSTDAVLGNDYYLGGGYLSGLGAGASATLNAGSMPLDLPPGTYYLIVELDYYHEIEETNEENNIHVIPGITITKADVDLRFASIEALPTQYQNSLATASASVTNDGSTNVGSAVSVQWYLSSDNTYSLEDFFLGTNLGDDEGYYDVGSQNLPAWTPGIYYFIAVLDPYNKYSETDETNNTIVSAPFELLEADIDLEFDETMYLSTFPDISWSFAVKNNGSSPAGNYELNFYLSKDDSFTGHCEPWEEPYCQQDIPLPYGGLTSTLGFTFFLPWLSGLEPGDYHLVVVINPTGEIIESNTDNNIYITPATVVHIPEPGPYVSYSLKPVAPALDNQTGIPFGVTFQNNGPDINTDYLDFNITVKNQAGSVMHEQTYGTYASMYSAQTRDEQWYLHLPQPLPAGNYTIQLTSSSVWLATANAETSMTILSAAPTFTVTGFVTGPDNTPIDNGKLFLYKKELNGVVHFVDKRVMDGTNFFSFEVDEKEHTLYFIPDPIAYPDYVPTILGKTVILQPTSFFTTSEPVTKDLEVLKIQPLAAGPMSVNGNVVAGSKNTAVRMASLNEESLAGFPVILLSQDGIPVMTTLTDADGNYKFENIPKGSYQIVVAFELDYPLMDEPLPVDVTVNDAVVGLDFSSGEQEVSLMHEQEISFSAFADKTFGDAAFNIDAITTSGLPLSVSSSNESVAKIENGKVVIIGAGETVIKASQAGDKFYLPAEVITRTLIVHKAQQSIEVDPEIEKYYGDAAFLLQSFISSGRPVSFSSNDEQVATISAEGKVSIISPGQATITIAEPGDNNFYPVSATVKISVYKALQKLTFGEPNQKVFGDPDFSLNVTTTSSLPLTISSSDESVATVNGKIVHIEAAGEVDITVKLGGNHLYSEAQEVRHLVIAKADQTINFEELPQFVDRNEVHYTLFAQATSKLPVTFTSDNTSVASVVNSVLTIHGPGEAIIVATQAGNRNYNPASAVARTVQVLMITDVPEVFKSLKVYPNPATHTLEVGGADLNDVKIYTLDGTSQRVVVEGPGRINVSHLPAGIFFLQVFSNGKRQTLKFMKQ
jgi:hypothetical protein